MTGGRRRYPSIGIDKRLERIKDTERRKVGPENGRDYRWKDSGCIVPVGGSLAAFRGLGSKAPTGRHADAEFRQIGTWPHNAAHYIQKR